MSDGIFNGIHVFKLVIGYSNQLDENLKQVKENLILTIFVTAPCIKSEFLLHGAEQEDKEIFLKTCAYV